MFLFVILNLLKDTAFSEQNPDTHFRIGTSGQNPFIIRYVNILILMEFAIKDLDNGIRNENRLCYFMKNFAYLELFDEDEQVEYVRYCESLEAKYLVIKSIFSAITQEFSEITEITMKSLEEFFQIIQRKQELNDLFIKRLIYLTSVLHRDELSDLLNLFQIINTFIIDKTSRFNTVYKYIRNNYR